MWKSSSLTRANILVTTAVLSAAAGCLAEPNGEQSLVEADKLTISCESMQEPLMDTGVGYLLPIPTGFRDVSSPPMYSFQSPRVGIWTEPATSINAKTWRPVLSTHAVSAHLDILTLSHDEPGGITIYKYALLKGENGLFVSSVAPLDLGSLLECLVPI